MGGWGDGGKGWGDWVLGYWVMEGWGDGMGRRGFCIGFGVVVCDVI